MTMTVDDAFASVMFPTAQNLRTHETILGLDGEMFAEPQVVKYAVILRAGVTVRLVGEAQDRQVSRSAAVTLAPPF